MAESIRRGRFGTGRRRRPQVSRQGASGQPTLSKIFLQSRGWAVFLLAWLTSAMASAQSPRYELGLRLRLLETAWDARTTSEDHRRAVPLLNQAVRDFFGANLAEAARSMDLARHALDQGTQVTAEETWAESLSMEVERRLVNAGDAFQLKLVRFYDAKVPPPAGVQCEFRLWDEQNQPLGEPLSASLAELPVSASLTTRSTDDADFRLTWTIRVDNSAVIERSTRVSVVQDLMPKLDQLQARIASLPPASESSLLSAGAATQRESLRHLQQLLQALANAESVETSYPANRLLRQALEATEPTAAGKPYFGPSQHGQFWLVLARDGHKIRVRLQVPECAQPDTQLPLVVALHGAGGSENLFFEGYGAGKVARLCQERGWYVAAPRLSALGGMPMDALVDELAQSYAIDRKRVYLVGHSMGAAQAVRAVQRSPEKFAGVCALGGGGNVTEEAALARMPFYIGVGSEDFALRSARNLRDRLQMRATGGVRYREYADVEHLMVVQQALDDVFAWLDELAAPTH